MPSGIKLTKQSKQEVVDYYLSHPMTVGNCAKQFGLSNPSVIKILDEFNITRYTRSKINNPNLNESYFSIIDTEAKAYFLGFIITDGNVFPVDDKGRQCSVSITQSECDKYILELFLNELGANTNVANDGRGTCTSAIRSNILAKDLEQYGVFPNKTLETFLPIIDKKLMPHLIRGILDGDGCIVSTITSRNKHKHAISFCGTHRLMDDIRNYLHKELGLNKPTVYDYQDRHLSEVKWQSIDDCYKFGEWLYKDATIYLTRKYEKYCNFKEHYSL